MAITILGSLAMYMEIPLADLQNVFLALGGLVAIDKVNAMFEERRLKPTPK